MRPSMCHNLIRKPIISKFSLSISLVKGKKFEVFDLSTRPNEHPESDSLILSLSFIFILSSLVLLLSSIYKEDLSIQERHPPNLSHSRALSFYPQPSYSLIVIYPKAFSISFPEAFSSNFLPLYIKVCFSK